MAAHVTVTPEQFTLVNYDAAEISAVVVDLAERLGVANPIQVNVNETTPFAKITVELDGSPSSDVTIALGLESGALEDSRHLQHFGLERAQLSIGRGLLRARDRMRADFADAPADADLTNEQAAAWDAYCMGRLTRAGLDPAPQRSLYDFRNRFGFSDDTDAQFERLWAAEDLSWADLPGN